MTAAALTTRGANPRAAAILAAAEEARSEAPSAFALSWHGGTEEEARERAAARVLVGAALGCARCSHVFAPGEVVHRRIARSVPVGHGTARAFCAECATGWPEYRRGEPRPCEGGCGVLVASAYRRWSEREGRSLPLYRSCSERCQREAERVRRRAASEVACASCGETFTQSRSDARYCSHACRQRAYRERARGGEADEVS